MTKQRLSSSGLGRFGEPGLLILLAVADRPRHGHAMLHDIEAHTGIKLGPGTLYGSISKLCDRGLIAPAGDEDRRQPYAITDAGRAALEEHLATWRSVVSLGSVRLGIA